MEFIKNNKFDIIVLVVLIVSIGLNIFCYAYKPKPKNQDKIDKLQTVIENNLRNQKQDQIKICELEMNLDSSIQYNKEPVYYYIKSKSKQDEKVKAYYSIDDSLRLYNGARRTVNYKLR